jgi:hypothetical protein
MLCAKPVYNIDNNKEVTLSPKKKTIGIIFHNACPNHKSFLVLDY